MPLRLNRVSLAAIGLVRRLTQGAGENDDGGDETPAQGMSMDDLVETGEQAYDEFLTGMVDARKEFEGRVRDFAENVLSGLGVATRREIEELKRNIEEKSETKDGQSGE
jgi:hypothetical protein